MVPLDSRQEERERLANDKSRISPEGCYRDASIGVLVCSFRPKWTGSADSDFQINRGRGTQMRIRSI
jgi:hypothetical protein